MSVQSSQLTWVTNKEKKHCYSHWEDERRKALEYYCNCFDTFHTHFSRADNLRAEHGSLSRHVSFVSSYATVEDAGTLHHSKVEIPFRLLGGNGGITRHKISDGHSTSQITDGSDMWQLLCSLQHSSMTLRAYRVTGLSETLSAHCAHFPFNSSVNQVKLIHFYSQSV